MTTEHRRGMIVPGTQLGHYQIISMLGAGGEWTNPAALAAVPSAP